MYFLDSKIFLLRKLAFQELVNCNYPSACFIQELPGATFQYEGVSLELFNEIPSNFYTLESIEDITTLNGEQPHHPFPITMGRDGVALCETLHSCDCDTNYKSEIHYGNVHKFTINFQSIKLACRSTVRKIGNQTFRGCQRVDGSQIISEWSCYDDVTGYTGYSEKSITLHPSHITHNIYEDIVFSGNHYRYDLFSCFKKVRRSQRNINMERFISLPLMYH